MPAVRKDVEATLVDRPDVDGATVIDYGAPGPVLALVRPDGFCSGPELRDACADVLEAAASRITVVLTTELPDLADGFPDPESLLAESVYVYRYEPATTETEERVVALWNRILDRNRTGVTDDFLDLGGDSVSAVRVVAEIRNEFGVDVDLMRFFNNPSVRHVAALVDAGRDRGTTG
ncbi:phosphopantetheine-binding protein [Micromonospora rifamycinica]|uniref:phosphopantetheine-binding protein n=1 Tax=Micromonospora rifamycinica TaxID=291594 RepID=UPI002E2DE3EE|nr:phosphopantetheine-binding protein [Micromonospora rifamycinica]